ncbi:MAG: tetratricopeptide repeat protein, partial [bacterium]|nr:tetratricopeptide repeat protein [bacterium]
LELGEREFGPHHEATVVLLNSLAMLFHTQGKYANAEPLYKRALAMREKALGPQHPDVAQILNNLVFRSKQRIPNRRI